MSEAESESSTLGGDHPFLDLDVELFDRLLELMAAQARLDRRRQTIGSRKSHTCARLVDWYLKAYPDGRPVVVARAGKAIRFRGRLTPRICELLILGDDDPPIDEEAIDSVVSDAVQRVERILEGPRPLGPSELRSLAGIALIVLDCSAKEAHRVVELVLNHHPSTRTFADFTRHARMTLDFLRRSVIHRGFRLRD